ncbi:hypothetical protein CLOSYM_03202 [[Clostridium] symbiosum ATCC 14940]|uniref:Uncharacterized protein n=1 Tax=[Clostridium] symbiosum ATCC 14940 TaxID=411472 RepID=A0ABC9TVA9_CLOSY|nr:hypothetical protein CLOSYM_03202 [[Clostridium] symbiosum ATCC 14940]
MHLFPSFNRCGAACSLCRDISCSVPGSGRNSGSYCNGFILVSWLVHPNRL